MKLLHHDILTKAHHFRTTLQDIMKIPRNLMKRLQYIMKKPHTHKDEITQNNDKQPQKKVMASHTPLPMSPLAADRTLHHTAHPQISQN